MHTIHKSGKQFRDFVFNTEEAASVKCVTHLEFSIMQRKTLVVWNLKS